MDLLGWLQVPGSGHTGLALGACLTGVLLVLARPGAGVHAARTPVLDLLGIETAFLAIGAELRLVHRRGL